MELLIDRNRYRMCEDSYLLEQASNNPNAELAIVLGERLEAALAEAIELEDWKTYATEDHECDLRNMDDKVYSLEIKIQQLEEKLNKEQNYD